MPPLTLHTVIAKEAADRLRHRVLEGERGSLYLGSTAPDIRVITRWERERTHFFDLTSFDEQRGDRGLMAHVLQEVARTDLELEIELFDVPTLRRWQEVMLEVVDHPPDWGRFRYIAGRVLRAAGG